jgi:hypothetical protein
MLVLASTAMPGSTSAAEPAAAWDADGDGLADAGEAALAARFAPVRFLPEDEPNRPTTVEDFLGGTSLEFYDAGCTPETHAVAATVTAAQLPTHRYASCDGLLQTSGGTRSRHKQHSFFLADVAPAQRSGSPDSARWTTYYHAYPNDLGGVTLQYWFFHAYNTGKTLWLPVIGKVGLGHGGDWEGFHLILDSARNPVAVRLLGHRELSAPVSWSDVPREGERPRVSSQWGSHTTGMARAEETNTIRQETWPGGRVAWRDGHASVSGSLVNLGEKTRPLQPFLEYSGLWGSPGFNFYRLGAALGAENFTSGYWGPAYNETGMREDGFIVAWCAGMADPDETVDGIRECFPAEQSD